MIDNMYCYIKFLTNVPSLNVQWSPLLCAPGLVKFVPAVARLFCLARPGSSLTMFAQNKGDLCTSWTSARLSGFLTPSSLPPPFSAFVDEIHAASVCFWVTPPGADVPYEWLWQDIPYNENSALDSCNSKRKVRRPSHWTSYFPNSLSFWFMSCKRGQEVPQKNVNIIYSLTCCLLTLAHWSLVCSVHHIESCR